VASNSVAELLGKFERVATTLPEAHTRAAQSAGNAGKTRMESAGRAARIPRPQGRNWSVRYLLTSGPWPTTVLFYRGTPPYWVEYGTEPHFMAAKLLGTRTGLRQRSRRIGTVAAFDTQTRFRLNRGNRGAFGPMNLTTTRRGEVRARNGKKALVINGDVRSYAFHPGARARPFWQPTKAAVFAMTPEYHRRGLVNGLVSAGFGR
jgi:hypothetical protein